MTKFLILMLLASWAAMRGGFAQNSQPASNQQQAAGSDTTFKLHAERNLVLVRVVVRDPKGNAVGGLHKEDFKVFDNKKPQIISEFSVESPEVNPAPAPASAASPVVRTAPPSPLPARPTPLSQPDRFVAFYFDDIHLSFEDAVRTREAAKKYLTGLGPGDRAAVFTSSGRLKQEFTSDRDKLDQTLDRLQPQPRTSGGVRECPDISPYQAWQIVDYANQDAIQLAVMDLIACQCNGDARMCTGASQEVEGYAMQVLSANRMESTETLRALANLVRHMAVMPGQRNIVFVSPGFLSEELKFELSELTERALHAKVVINSLDSRGLYVIIPGGDASSPGFRSSSPQYVMLKSNFEKLELDSSADALSVLAADTGGLFFQNSNDYAEGFRRTGGVSETSYVLAFSPENLKHDGAFHSLKVNLVQRSKFTVQARRGYYAPRKKEDTVARAQDDLADAVFSRSEIREMPLDIQTKFSKTDDLNTRLSVLAHVDVSSVRFRKQEQRNLDDLTMVAALFDDDGNYVAGNQVTIQMRLKDSTLEHIQRTGVGMRVVLAAKPGRYSVRVVVRDSESSLVSTMNRSVEIPE
jgi:VWFA-related protein